MKKLLLLPCLAMALAGADITGKWSGNIEVADSSSGTTQNTAVRLELAQKDNTLSGKIGRRDDVQAEQIRNGRVEGNKVLFEVQSAETAANVKFALTIEGDKLEGEMKGSMDSNPISGKVHLTRQAGE